MGFRLVDDDLDLSFDIPLSSDARRGLSVQLQRNSCGQEKQDFESKLCQQLTFLLDEDLLPPSRRQVSYALSIARTLDIPLPGEALQFRGAMHDYLQRHAALFRQRLEEANDRSQASRGKDIDIS
jgi:hypothetical protein